MWWYIEIITTNVYNIKKKNILQYSEITDQITLLENSCYTPKWGTPFGDYSYHICLWGLKVCWLAGFMAILWIVCTILFSMHFDKFAMTFIDIG